jgi:polysaccharide export outer membrane protein
MCHSATSGIVGAPIALLENFGNPKYGTPQPPTVQGWGTQLMVRWFLFASLILGSTFITAGCAVLPSSGPMASDIAEQEKNTPIGNYLLVDIDERVTSIYASQPRDSFRSVFRDYSPAPDLRIGVSDSVVVTIWEAAAGGLFSAAPNAIGLSSGSRTATIPEQVVARDGTIAVPYAGRLRVVGLRPAEVENAIVEALRGKAIEPQAVVTISRNMSNTVTVGGEVVSGIRVPLSTKGDRVLDVIASAGGIKVSAYDSFIRLTRGRRTVSVPYNALLSNPQENVYVRPGDIVTVVREPLTFTAFGSTGRNASVPFETSSLSLEEALAKAGGLLDSRADPAGIFLLRFEPTKLAAAIAGNRSLPSAGNLIPIIYRLNLRQANSFFLARAFSIKDKDILYVSNAPSDPVQKFLGLVGTVTSPIIAGAAVYGGVR